MNFLKVPEDGSIELPSMLPPKATKFFRIIEAVSVLLGDHQDQQNFYEFSFFFSHFSIMQPCCVQVPATVILSCDFLPGKDDKERDPS